MREADGKNKTPGGSSGTVYPGRPSREVTRRHRESTGLVRSTGCVRFLTCLLVVVGQSAAADCAPDIAEGEARPSIPTPRGWRRRSQTGLIAAPTYRGLPWQATFGYGGAGRTPTGTGGRRPGTGWI